MSHTKEELEGFIEDAHAIIANPESSDADKATAISAIPNIQKEIDKLDGKKPKKKGTKTKSSTAGLGLTKTLAKGIIERTAYSQRSNEKLLNLVISKTAKLEREEAKKAGGLVTAWFISSTADGKASINKNLKEKFDIEMQ